MQWRRKWQPTPVFLPGESPGRGSLVGCRLWGRTESDMTEVTQQQQVEKRATDAEMVGWHHRPTGHEFEQAPGDREGQGGLACCSPRRRRGGHG